MKPEEKIELLSRYFCVFRGNPIHCTPYAMFATLPPAVNSIRTLGVTGPLTFTEWLKDFQPPDCVSPDKPLWQD
jgi:hypothetical protein